MARYKLSRFKVVLRFLAEFPGTGFSRYYAEIYPPKSETLLCSFESPACPARFRPPADKHHNGIPRQRASGRATQETCRRHRHALIQHQFEEVLQVMSQGIVNSLGSQNRGYHDSPHRQSQPLHLLPPRLNLRLHYHKIKVAPFPRVAPGAGAEKNDGRSRGGLHKPPCCFPNCLV